MKRIKEKEKGISLLREFKVVKANMLIQNARYQLSTQEQKIVLYIISKIKPDDDKLQEYEFNIIEFCKICGIDYNNGGNYRLLKDTIKKLSDKSIWVTLDDGRETLLRWVEKPFMDKKSGIVRIKLDEMMKPYLLQLKEKFTQYELMYTLPMKSQYSIRLYEFLKSYEWRHKVEIDIDKLKNLLLAEKYTLFGDFKVNVLDMAMRELETFSDLNISFELIKSGRKYVKIIFIIDTKKDMQEKINTWNSINESLDSKKEMVFIY